LPKAAQEISRVLKPGGQFLIVTAHPDAHATWKARYAETKLEGKRLEGKLKNLDQSESSEVLYLHELGEILSAFQAAGLNIQRSESFRLFFLFQGSKK
jgi:ubiquinone/menaquinone biosynthesis C-methylase UbiE